MRQERRVRGFGKLLGAFRASAAAPEQKGVILIVAILALLAMAIFLPALYFVIGNESKWAVKQKKTTTAFHMAEQGLDRGEWKLRESDEIWNQASTGSIIAGYNFDVVYASTGSDGVQGEYKVRIASGTDTDTVVIQSVGRDKSTDEIRALEGKYSKVGGVDAGLIVRGTLSYASNMVVHWGPVVCYGNITNTNTDKYPRKIAKGYITGRDTDPNSPNGHDYFETWPDPATYDYSAYQTDLGDPPDIKLDQYKTLAKNSSVPALKQANGNGAASGNIPAGSGYYDGSDNKDYDLTKADGSALNFTCSTCVIFIDNVAGSGNLELKDSASKIKVKALIVKGNFDYNGDPVSNTVVRIPVGAKTEYSEPTARTYWNTNFEPTGEGNNYTVTKNAKIWGYVYIGGSANSGGSDPTIIGVADCVGTWSSNNTIIYYDADVSTGILTSGLTLRRISWRESKRDW